MGTKYIKYLSEYATLKKLKNRSYILVKMMLGSIDA